MHVYLEGEKHGKIILKTSKRKVHINNLIYWVTTENSIYMGLHLDNKGNCEQFSEPTKVNVISL